MTVNTKNWQRRGIGCDPFNPGKPGAYASGGPTDNVLDIYRAAAPAIDILAPDILIARIGRNEFLVTGRNARITFGPAEPLSADEGFLMARVEEGHFDAQGQWTFERLWNGDQTDYGLNFTTQPQVLRVKLATY